MDGNRRGRAPDGGGGGARVMERAEKVTEASGLFCLLIPWNRDLSIVETSQKRERVLSH